MSRLGQFLIVVLLLCLSSLAYAMDGTRGDREERKEFEKVYSDTQRTAILISFERNMKLDDTYYLSITATDSYPKNIDVPLPEDRVFYIDSVGNLLVQLQERDPSTFAIKSISPAGEEQPLLPNEATQWQWLVKPLRTGKGSLLILIANLVTLGGHKSSKSLPVHVIDVDVTEKAKASAAQMSSASSPRFTNDQIRDVSGEALKNLPLRSTNEQIQSDSTRTSIALTVSLIGSLFFIIATSVVLYRRSKNSSVLLREISNTLKFQHQQKQAPFDGPPERIKILFLSANPQKTSRLRIDEEVREVQKWFSRAQYERMTDSDSQVHDYLEFASEFAVSVEDLPFLLQKHQPHILHFSGHGSASSEILLEDQTGAPTLVSIDTLQRLLSVLKDNLRCVVLNACYSQRQASEIAQIIDCVVGMSTLIQDRTAIQFAAAFYQALAFGRTIEEAFRLGQIQTQLSGQQDYYVPQLIMRSGVDPSKLRILHRKVQP